MKIVKPLITAGLIGLISEVGAQTIGQRVWDAHNGVSSNGTIVNCWVNNGSSGIQKDTVDIYGNWWVPAGNFNPPPVAGDTIKSVDTLVYGGIIYTGRMRCLYTGSNTNIPTGFLDDPNKNVVALSVGANKVKNRSLRPQYKMNAKGWLQKNPNQKIQFINYFRRALGQDSLAIDTTDIHNQLYFNLEKQDSIWRQGDVFITMIYQIKGDTMWYQYFSQVIDTTKYGRASIVDSLRYTADSMIIGIVEEKLENKVKEGLIIKPNPARNYLISTKEAILYDALGRKIKKIDKGKNNLDLNSGVYFVKKDEDIEKLVIYK
ncbi:MAG: T9SS type A sorting domain-containing protein [Candidatus Pacearchaeota archaeon]